MMSDVKLSKKFKPKLERIKSILGTPVKTWKVYGSGWDNYVIEVNKEWIFRFAKDDDKKQRQKIELELFKKFGPVSPVPLPKIEYYGEDYMAYRKIHGQPLSDKLLEDLTNSQRHQVAKQLADFLTALHNFKKPIRGIEDKWPSGKAWTYTAILNNLKEHLSPVAFKNISEKLESYFSDKGVMGGEKTLVHGDFHGENILVLGGKTVSVIDFGDAQMGTPAMDFAKIYCHFDMKKFSQEIIDRYKRPLDEHFEKRLDFMVLFFELIEARYSFDLHEDRDYYCALAWLEENHGDKTKAKEYSNRSRKSTP